MPEPIEPILPQRDALIDEVRAIRRAIARDAGNDVDRLCDALVETERLYGAGAGEFTREHAKTAEAVVADWAVDAATSRESR